MDRLEAMAVLVAVADKGGFSAAARARRMPVTTVSRKVSDLEGWLGAKLLLRTTRKVSLTDAGLAFVAAARRILDEVDEAQRNAAGEFATPKGELVVTAPIYFGRRHVMPVVEEFLQLYAQISVRMVFLDRNVPLVDDHVDMAVRIGFLPDSTMIATRVGSLRMVVCASPRYLERHGTPTAPEELSAMPCITFDAPLPSPAWSFRNPGGGMSEVQVDCRLSVSLAEAAVEAAVRDVGVVRLLEYQVADAIKAGTLRSILEAFEPDPVPVHLLHADRGQLPLKMRLFLDLAAPRLRDTLNQIHTWRTKTVAA